MTYTADSPAVKRAVKTYFADNQSRPVVVALTDVLNEHKRGLQDLITATQSVNEINGKVIADLIAQRDDLAEQVSELTDLLEAARTGDGMTAPARRANQPTHQGDPMTYTADSPAQLVAVLLDIAEQAKFLSDRLCDAAEHLIPAEPVDPDAAAIEAMAKAAAKSDGEKWGDLDAPYRRSYVDGARAPLVAYRTHIDKEA